MITEEVYEELMKKLPPPPPKSKSKKGQGGGKGENQQGQGGGGQGDNDEQDEQDDKPAKVGEAGDVEDNTDANEGKPGDQPGEEMQDDGGWGEVYAAENDNGEELSAQETEQEQADLRRTIAQAEQIAKSRGKMSAALGQIVETMRKPSHNWKDVLRDMIKAQIPTDFTFDRPSRMHMGSDFVMPSTDKEGMGHVAFYVDDSGSVSDSEMRQFAADVNSIFEELSPEKITVIHFDYEAAPEEEFEQHEEVVFVRRLHGGTRFSAPFNAARKRGLDQDFQVCIVLTDGQDCSYPDFIPDYPVIWATTGAMYQGDPPFGDVLAIKFDRD